jgi:hypothetical protein
VLYSILTEFDTYVELVMIMKMCLNETSSKVRIDNHFYDAFPVRSCLTQGYALLP